MPPALLPAALVALGLIVMFTPVFVMLAHTVWNTDEQGHGPIILALVVWLLWQRRERFAAAVAQATPAGFFGWLWLVFGLCLYVLGRVQYIVMFEMGSIIPLLTGALAVTFGWRMVRIAAFPIFFLLFAVPLPGPLVDMLTQPLKQGVSWVAEQIIYAAGYPISRTGVILMVGPYQLLVADACAGLNSMFTLEALGLLYMNLVGHTSKLRNVLLAILIVPMSFGANVIRVMVLVLVTYHFGDEAGQGIVHGAAGMLLFTVGLGLMLLLDSALGLLFRREAKA
ncbi:exosortase B [Piscinibacter sp.]|uniref:exosortase B n=1 Tax=Piscinibacter sp. TaxID=1903157 RepID=UPI002F40841A